jgi:hypothetical protein
VVHPKISGTFAYWRRPVEVMRDMIRTKTKNALIRTLYTGGGKYNELYIGLKLFTRNVESVPLPLCPVSDV